MRLVVVYGLKTGDYEWLRSFYPAHRIVEACARQRVHILFVLPCDVDRLVSGGFSPADDFFPAGGFSPADAVCLVRGNVDPGSIQRLEEAGFRCVNGSKAVALALDKLECARFLDKLGIQAPRTFAPVVGAGGRAGVAGLVGAMCAAGESPLGYPFVAKPRFGSRGRGVALVKGPADLEALAPLLRSEPYIFQEFVAESAGRDLRFFFAGGEIVACVERRGKDDSFVSNASEGGLVRIPENCEALVERLSSEVLRIAREAGLWYGTVDFLFGTEEFPVCEINACPGFEALEKATGLDIAGMLVERLMRDFDGA
jgi:RimK family alpha-L-glutamate ligase